MKIVGCDLHTRYQPGAPLIRCVRMSACLEL